MGRLLRRDVLELLPCSELAASTINRLSGYDVHGVCVASVSGTVASICAIFFTFPNKHIRGDSAEYNLG